MTDAKHTPGEWTMHPEDLRGGKYWVVTIPDCETIDLHDDDNGEANACLIAAAPEMLEALKVVMQHGRIDDSEERMSIVGAAIAKATGQ